MERFKEFFVTVILKGQVKYDLSGVEFNYQNLPAATIASRYAATAIDAQYDPSMWDCCALSERKDWSYDDTDCRTGIYKSRKAFAAVSSFGGFESAGQNDGRSGGNSPSHWKESDDSFIRQRNRNIALA